MRQLTGSRLPRIMPFMSNVECLLLGISTVCNGSDAVSHVFRKRTLKPAALITSWANRQRLLRPRSGPSGRSVSRSAPGREQT